MILFAGDRWLEKLSNLFVEFFPAEAIAFRHMTDDTAVSELESMPGTVVVATTGAAVLSRNTSVVEVPRMLVDGLSSLEVVGQKLAGGDYLPAELTLKERARMADAIARKDISFGCLARLGESLATMSASGPVGRATADYIRDNFRDRNLMSGIDRPNPVLTVAVARIVAERIGLNSTVIDRRDPWRTDHVAYRESTRVLLPSDYRALGLRMPAEPCWYSALLRLSEIAYDETDRRRPSLLEERPEAATMQAWLKKAATGPIASPLAALFSLKKQNDLTGLMAELQRLLEQWALLSQLDRDFVLRSVLKWFPEAGSAEEGIVHVLNYGPSLSPDLARKLVSVTANQLPPEAIATLVPQLRDREEFTDVQIAKLERLAGSHL